MTKLRMLLDERGIKQRELYEIIAEKCITPIGLDRISKIVSGKSTNYEVNTLMKICIALDVTPNDVLERDPFIKSECKNIS